MNIKLRSSKFNFCLSFCNITVARILPFKSVKTHAAGKRGFNAREIITPASKNKSYKGLYYVLFTEPSPCL